MFRYGLAILMFCAPLLAAASKPERFDVRDFGAVGDGIADDQPALVRAVQAVTQNKGGVLYFPSGVYRCARQAGMQNGIQFVGVSGVTIQFDPGAVLLMDNLNPDKGTGDHGHGILFRGPCHDIALMNVAVKWAKKASGRSMGDAFRFEGFPSDDKCISNLKLLQCSAELSPQTGAVIMGCSDIDVENFRVTRTYADGLHFNACRRIHVSGVTGIETGDDTLAFVTYQDDKEQTVDNGAHGPYSRADLGEWNCTDSTATGVYARGGTANGVRLAGALNVSLSNLIIDGKLRGVIADCGKKDVPKHGWSWFASRGITISNLTAIRCNSGLFVSNFNQPMSGDDRWWRYDLQVSNLNARDCKDESLLISDAAGVAVRGAKAQNSGIRLTQARDCVLDGVDLNNGDMTVKGQADDSGMQDAPQLDLALQHIHIDKGFLDIKNCTGLTCTDVRITHAQGAGLRTSGVLGCRLDGISVGDPIHATAAEAPTTRNASTP